MKHKIKVQKEVDLKTLKVFAGVRYWEDAEVNGEPDTEYGDNIPCKKGNTWAPIIDIDTGKILNWETGKSADVHYKVCDNGRYYVNDSEDNTVLSIEDGYVPGVLCPLESGFGDYIIMRIDENGIIQGWKFDPREFEND